MRHPQQSPEAVWFSTEIRKARVLGELSHAAFGLWTELPFLVVVGDDGSHTISNMPEAARASSDDIPALMAELVEAEFVEPLSDGSGGYRMTELSRQYYSLTEPEEDSEEDAGA